MRTMKKIEPSRISFISVVKWNPPMYPVGVPLIITDKVMPMLRRDETSVSPRMMSEHGTSGRASQPLQFISCRRRMTAGSESVNRARQTAIQAMNQAPVIIVQNAAVISRKKNAAT